MGIRAIGALFFRTRSEALGPEDLKAGKRSHTPGKPGKIDAYWNDHPPPVAVSTGFMHITGICASLAITSCS